MKSKDLQVDQALTTFIAKLKLQQSSLTITLQTQPPSPQGSATKAVEPGTQPVFVPEPDKATGLPAVPSAVLPSRLPDESHIHLTADWQEEFGNSFSCIDFVFPVDIPSPSLAGLAC